MRLDIPTLSLVVTLVYSLNVLISILVYFFRRTFDGARYWILGQVSIGLGFAGLLFRSDLPEFIAITMVNTLFIASPIFFAHSLWVFRYKSPFPRAVYLLIPTVASLFFVFQESDFTARAALFSIFQAIVSFFVVGILVYRVERDYRAANYLMALPFFLLGIANTLRVPLNLMAPPFSDFNSQSGYNAIFFLLSAGVASITLFGYFMMTSIRSERELRLKEEEIGKRNRELDELNRSKDLFFSILAHDLRGPIGGMARYVRRHLLASREDMVAKWKALEILASTLDGINSLLEKLLQWSRAGQEAWKPKPESLDLPGLIEDAVALLEFEVEAKALRIELPARGPNSGVFADRESVALILRNLLSNAMKFSPRGGRLEVSIRDEDQFIRTIVADEGTGIEKEMLPLLFRMDAKQARRGTMGETGSGMGLILCRTLVEKNLGKIELESEFGKGTRVSFWLPRPPRSRP
jgi:signal transduction histidine kinase